MELTRFCIGCGASFTCAETSIRRYCTNACATHKLQRTHGHALKGAKSPTYMSYSAMIARCTNPNHEKFPAYGGRGITVCDRWREGFATFLEDMGERPSGMTLDRIDGTKGYEPLNCRWANASAQQANTSANIHLEFNGQSHIVAEWARLTGIDHRAILKRLKRGWSVEQTLSMPSTRTNSVTRTGHAKFPPALS